ncbi:MAG: AMP-binding protein [Burkholderiales bacterium]|nr:AMP-binding protein [Burkholderiales bacterium]
MQDSRLLAHEQADAFAGKLTPLEVLRLYPPHDGTLIGALESRLQVDPERAFLLYRGRIWSRRSFRDAALDLARALVARGIKSGDRVGIVARNHEGHLLLLFALARIGAILVPANPEFGAAEINYLLGKAEVSAVAVSPECLATVRAAVADLAVAPWFIMLGGAAEGAVSLDELLRGDTQTMLPPNPSADTSCLIIFTSGSTGFPKGALHSQRNFVSAGEANVSRLWLQPDDRLMTVLPLFHVNALFYSAAGTLAAGACCVLIERFSASAFWDTAVETGATTVNIIEAIGRILVARPLTEFRTEHRIRSVYGARADVREHFRTVFHIPHLLTGFGMTEIPGVCCAPFGGPDLPGAMGPVGRHPDPQRPWAQLRVVDDEGRDLPDGVEGELWVKHPIVMQGYFRDDEQTRASFQDGWFKTGDLVRRDADGCFWFVTRKKDIIRRRGENIAGAELDRVICEHPDVMEAAAIPVPSELGEDEILVCVVPRAGAALSAEDVADWCRDRLAPMKVPRFVLVTAELPHTPTHKVNKQTLKNDPTLRSRAVDFAPVR